MTSTPPESNGCVTIRQPARRHNSVTHSAWHWQTRTCDGGDGVSEARDPFDACSKTISRRITHDRSKAQITSPDPRSQDRQGLNTNIVPMPTNQCQIAERQDKRVRDGSRQFDPSPRYSRRPPPHPTSQCSPMHADHSLMES